MNALTAMEAGFQVRQKIQYAKVAALQILGAGNIFGWDSAVGKQKLAVKAEPSGPSNDQGHIPLLHILNSN